MKNLFKSILVLAIFSFVAVSCSDDEGFAAPTISNLEIGEGHHHKTASKEHDHDEHAVGHIGEDLHVEAEIVAEGKIDYILVEIHNEETNAEVVEKKFSGEGFTGLKNTTFHQHIDIPATTEEGEYHFHIKVVDQLGQSTMEERELELEKE